MFSRVPSTTHEIDCSEKFKNVAKIYRQMNHLQTWDNNLVGMAKTYGKDDRKPDDEENYIYLEKAMSAHFFGFSLPPRILSFHTAFRDFDNSNTFPAMINKVLDSVTTQTKDAVRYLQR